MALPLAPIERRPEERFWQILENVVAERGIRMVIVGLPLHSCGGESDASRAARALATAISERFGCEVAMWDERFTTVQATRMLQDAGKSTRGIRKVVDSASAVLLLESWLQRQRNGVLA